MPGAIGTLYSTSSPRSRSSRKILKVASGMIKFSGRLGQRLDVRFSIFHLPFLIFNSSHFRVISWIDLAGKPQNMIHEITRNHEMTRNYGITLNREKSHESPKESKMNLSLLIRYFLP